MPDEAAHGRAPPSPAYAWYVIAVLMVLNVSSFIDRQVMALLVTPIKADLGLSDTEMGILLGPAFAVTFALAVILVGPLADRASRRAIIGWGVAVWSVMCTASGLANTFGQLFATRVGVGVGEATLSPSAYSLIADYFPPQRLATAMSVFTSGVFVGAGLAYLIGGLMVEALQDSLPWNLPFIGDVRPWQRVFIILGVAGLALSFLVLTIREPARGRIAGQAGVTFSAGDRRRWASRHRAAYLTFGIGIAAYAIVNYATAFWFPSFFERSHQWGAGKIGVFMGGSTAVFGTLGVLAGGRLADWLKTRGRPDGNLRVLVGSALVSIVAGLPLFLSTSEPVVIGALIVTNIVAAAPFGAAAAAAQEMTPAPMRGTASAVLVFLLNFIGLGVGPPVAAFLTDNVFADPAKVGLSLLTVTVVGRTLAAALVGAGLGAHRRAVAELAKG
jgi:MFS family permease